MRRLPHLDVNRAKIALDLYKDKMRLNLSQEDFVKGLTLIYTTAFGLTERQAIEVLEALPGLGKGIMDFTDDEQVGIWPWTDPSPNFHGEGNGGANPKDHSDLELWGKLSHPPHSDGEYTWKHQFLRPVSQIYCTIQSEFWRIPNPNRWEDYGNETGLI